MADNPDMASWEVYQGPSGLYSVRKKTDALAGMTVVPVAIRSNGAVSFPAGIPAGFFGISGGNGPGIPAIKPEAGDTSFLAWTKKTYATQGDPLGFNTWAARTGTPERVQYIQDTGFNWDALPVQGSIIFDPATGRPKTVVESNGTAHPFQVDLTADPALLSPSSQPSPAPAPQPKPAPSPAPPCQQKSWLQALAEAFSALRGRRK